MSRGNFKVMLVLVLCVTLLTRGSRMPLNDHDVPNGFIIHTQAFVPHAYESLSLSDRANTSSKKYADYVAWYESVDDVIVEKIIYKSDGMPVVGFIVRQKNTDEKKRPVIVYCRGGSNDDGKITVTTLKNRIYPLVKAGYVVVASQYRGNDGGEGHDECGGMDVNDVVALFDTIKTLPYVDQKNVFMIGYSRGPIDMYQAIKAGVQPNAIAAIAGIVDLIQFKKERPEATELLESMIFHASEKLESEYQKRSAIFWSEVIKTPVLLLHGDADTIVRSTQSEKMADALAACGTPHKLVLYSQGNHFLKEYKNDIVQEMMAWFEQYKNKDI